jgi:protein-L-isoaspartate(D-aspartate) O-methyltransferase
MQDLNIEIARHNMVEQQVRPWEVLDQRVLDLIARSPRDEYVPAKYRSVAYADLFLPLGQGQTMLTPKLEARMLQELEIGPTDRILEIGTGSGYFTSLLAAMGAHVYSVDIYPEFVDAARAKLAAHGVQNVTLETGDAARGWNQHGPYDVIAITGSMPELPDEFVKSLAHGGRLMAFLGKSPVMEAVRIRRLGGENLERTSIFETDVPALVNAYEPAKFIF